MQDEKDVMEASSSSYSHPTEGNLEQDRKLNGTQSDLQLGAPMGPSIFRNRNFMLMWTAQAISQTAQQSVWYALPVVVQLMTNSTTQLSIAIISAILPSVIFSLLAGIIVDRMEKRGVMLWTTAARAIVMLGYLLYPVALPAVFIINFLSNTLTQFFQPAESSMMPQLVPKRKLLIANSLYNITFNGSQVVGFVILGPVLLKIFGPPVIFIAAAVLTALAAAEVWMLPPSAKPEHSLRELKRETVVSELFGDIRAAWRFIIYDYHTVLAMLHLTLTSMLTLLVATLAPAFAIRVLHIRADDAVFVLAPAGLGLAAGAAILNQLTKFWNRSRLVMLGMWVLGGGFILLGLIRTIMHWLLPVVAPDRFTPTTMLSLELVPPVMVITLILGLSLSFVMIPAQTALMERAPQASLGRIIAAQLALGNLASIFPLLLIGQLADHFGINQVIAGVGIFIMMIAIFTFWYPHSTYARSASQKIEVEAASR